MPFPLNLPARLRSLLFGDPFGEVFPPRAAPPAATQQVDGRTVALNLLRDYVCALVFYCPAGRGSPPIPFQVLPANFHLMQPKAVDDLVFPSAVVQPSRATYAPIGLVSFIEEDTRDVYAPGTAVQWQAEYQETINLELWASEEPALRSLLAGIETAISPTEQMSGLRFRMPDYFDQLVCFTLNRRENYGEADAAKGRRRAQVEIEMRFNIVALVSVVSFQPQVFVDPGYDAQTLEPLDLSPPTLPPTDPRSPTPPPPGTEYVVPPDASDSPGPRWPMPPNWTG